MRLKVLFFAGLREIFSNQNEDIEVDRNIDSIDKLIEHMTKLNEDSWLELFNNKSLYEISLIFSGNSTVLINSEVIDVVLDDQENYYMVKNFPKHKL